MERSRERAWREVFDWLRGEYHAELLAIVRKKDQTATTLADNNQPSENNTTSTMTTRRRHPGRDTSLRRLLAAYRLWPCDVWLGALLLLMENDLSDLFRVVRGRIGNDEEGLSLVLWGCLRSARDTGEVDTATVTVESYFAVVKGVVYRELRYEAERHRERRMDPAWAIWERLRPEPPAEDSTYVELCDRLREALNNLEPGEREIVEEVYLHGNSERDAARNLAMSRSGLKRRLERVKSTIAKELGFVPGSKKSGDGCRCRWRRDISGQ